MLEFRAGVVVPLGPFGTLPPRPVIWREGQGAAPHLNRGGWRGFPWHVRLLAGPHLGPPVLHLQRPCAEAVAAPVSEDAGSLDPWIAGSLDPWVPGSLDRWIAGSDLSLRMQKSMFGIDFFLGLKRGP